MGADGAEAMARWPRPPGEGDLGERPGLGQSGRAGRLVEPRRPPPSPASPTAQAPGRAADWVVDELRPPREPRQTCSPRASRRASSRPAGAEVVPAGTARSRRGAERRRWSRFPTSGAARESTHGRASNPFGIRLKTQETPHLLGKSAVCAGQNGSENGWQNAKRLAVRLAVESQVGLRMRARALNDSAPAEREILARSANSGRPPLSCVRAAPAHPRPAAPKSRPSRGGTAPVSRRDAPSA